MEIDLPVSFKPSALSPAEWAGVSGVGLVFGIAGAYAAAHLAPSRYHMHAMIAAGALSYIAGVAIGARRPSRGWLR